MQSCSLWDWAAAFTGEVAAMSEQVCGMCKYNSYDRQDSSFYCGNEDSWYYGCMTAYSDTCEEYTDKEENTWVKTDTRKGCINL